MYCKKCGKQIDDKAVICVHCGQLTDNYYPQKTAGSATVRRNEFYAPLSGLIVSLIIPLVGFIMSIVQYRNAKAVYGETKYAVAGIVAGSVLLALNLLINIIMMYKSAWAGIPWAPTLF